MRDEEFVERVMEAMTDPDLVDVHRMDKLKEVCSEMQEHRNELASIDLNECEGGACKL